MFVCVQDSRKETISRSVWGHFSRIKRERKENWSEGKRFEAEKLTSKVGGIVNGAVDVEATVNQEDFQRV